MMELHKTGPGEHPSLRGWRDVLAECDQLRRELDAAVADNERLKLIANAARDVLAARDSGADNAESAVAWENLSAARDVGTSRLLVLAAEREDFAEAVRSALRLIGSWREAICLLEDFCSEPVQLKNMRAAADSIDDWVKQVVDLLTRINDQLECPDVKREGSNGTTST